MNSELTNNKELQELLNGLLPENVTEDEEQPLGKFGRMAMEHLYQTNPQRFSLLKMQGELLNLMYRVDAEASEQLEKITRLLEEKKSFPPKKDFFAGKKSFGGGSNSFGRDGGKDFNRNPHAFEHRFNAAGGKSKSGRDFGFKGKKRNRF